MTDGPPPVRMGRENAMRRIGWFVICWLVVAVRPVAAGPEAPLSPPRSWRPVAPARPLPGRPRVPEPPPAEQLPGPLSRDEQRRFDALRIRGIRLYEEGRYPEAARHFRAALRLKPDDPVTRGWLRAAEERGR